MIPADEAFHIMQKHEAAYDNFLNKLRSNVKAKKQTAKNAQAQADQSEQRLKQAEGARKMKLGEKARDLINRAGGIEGITRTVQNVTRYFKDTTPSDYDLSFGTQVDAAPAEKKILGMPPVVVYAGSAILLLGGIYLMTQVMKKNAVPQIPAPPAYAMKPQTQPVL